MLNKYVKLGKSKNAKYWKIVGISMPLPEMGGGRHYVFSR